MADNEYRWPFLVEIRKLMEKAITESKCEGSETACASYSAKSGYIDLWCDSQGNSEVIVNHWNHNDTDHSNLESLVLDAMPEWDEVEVTYDDDTPSDWAMYYNRL